MNPKILEFPAYFIKNMGQNSFFFSFFLFTVGTLQEILGYVGTRLADRSLYSVSTFSVFSFLLL